MMRAVLPGFLVSGQVCSLLGCAPLGVAGRKGSAEEASQATADAVITLAACGLT